MDKNQEMRKYLEQMFESSPKNFIQKLDDKSRGLHTILHYLNSTKSEICAVDISKKFQVSSARVAVAMRALEKKGWVVTSHSDEDRRKVIVKITEEGKAVVKRDEEELIDFLMFLKDGIGEDDFKEFLRIFTKINNLVASVNQLKLDEKIRHIIRKNTYNKNMK